VALALAGPGRAQDDTPPTDLALGQVQSPVLTIDVDRLFSASLFGQRAAEEIRLASEDLAAENRQIEAALTEEERSLTLRRPTMTPEAFQAEAAAFDEKVQGIRAAQDAKEADLQQALTRHQDAFLQVATPVLGQLMRDSGAAVILDRRSIFLSLGAVDITDRAIGLIDAAIGDGATLDDIP
jgi:Skp family chaperone for outer membrane proteins